MASGDFLRNARLERASLANDAKEGGPSKRPTLYPWRAERRRVKSLAVIPGLEGKFNEVPAAYDRWRPGYVQELYRDLWAYQPIGPDSRALEIGIGTGQATPPVLATGCTLTAVELGNQLAAYTAKKFQDYRRFAVYPMAFQQYDGPEQAFDLIYSASAFHWIPEEIGYPKVYRLLKPGGAFARFANHPYRSPDALHEALQEVYAKYMPFSPPSPPYTQAQCAQRAQLAEKYGFVDIQYRMYHRTRTFTAQEYPQLLGTYSDHRAVEEQARKQFFREIEQVIETFGGTITLSDTLDLQLARKPLEGG